MVVYIGYIYSFGKKVMKECIFIQRQKGIFIIQFCKQNCCHALSPMLFLSFTCLARTRRYTHYIYRLLMQNDNNKLSTRSEMVFNVT